ncbi:hypothetical protein FGG08_004182 [Glutinoglossum americanum]|uniref:Nicotinamide N-methyltransferase n=1 Tax=Glutinoglossum americanum TaxID=1670608 RepID=A0A9P8L2Z5_9PEZI|nr:hypothetical protein FGG08_004182 [Glutinoglossum americanum]
MLLTDKIDLPSISSPEPEDIFSSAIGLIFTDDVRNQHGEPGNSVIYKSSCFGDIELRLVDPKAEDVRLFAHYLWNASVQLAELVSGDDLMWRVRGERVLELGAGSGLAGIISALAGAEEVVISDYPAPEILENISLNISRNIPSSIQPCVSVQGHIWGLLSDELSTASKGKFNVILAADVFWMPGQHRNLAHSMLYFLSKTRVAKVFVIAGFHTGRANLARFFDVAVEEGLVVESILERDAQGNERAWKVDRGLEDVFERKKWLVMAILARNFRIVEG